MGAAPAEAWYSSDELCDASILQAARGAARRVMTCQKAHEKEHTQDQSGCELRAFSRLERALQRRAERSDCDADLFGEAIFAEVDIARRTVAEKLISAFGDEPACRRALARAARSSTARLLGCYARRRRFGLEVDAGCEERALSVLESAFERRSKLQHCEDIASSASVLPAIEACVAGVAGIAIPQCGNGPHRSS